MGNFEDAIKELTERENGQDADFLFNIPATKIVYEIDDKISNFNQVSLMIKDKEVLILDRLKCSEEVVDEELLPLSLRAAGRYNYNSLLWSWMSSRVRLLNERKMKYYKAVINMFNLPPDLLHHIAAACNCLSLTDCYWVNFDEEFSWEDVNLYENEFSEEIADAAFHGRMGNILRKNTLTPELTTGGFYPKCWKKDGDGIWLYKSNLGNQEPEVEFLCSQVLDILQVDHVNYELTELNGEVASRCLNITDFKLSIVPFTDFYYYQRCLDKDGLQEVEKRFPQKYYQMLLADGIISNVARHGFNWGLYMNNETGEVVDLHPLLDHNHVLGAAGEEGASRVMKGKSLIEAAKYAYTELNNPPEVRELEAWIQTERTKDMFAKMFGGIDKWQMLKENVRRILR